MSCKSHCCCCYPSCPVPTIEIEDRQKDCWPPQGYRRAASYRSTIAPDPYVVPAPESCQYFKTLKEDYSASGSFSSESTYYDANTDTNVPYERELETASGASYLYITQGDICGCDTGTDYDTYTGGSTFVWDTKEYRIHSEESGGVVTYTRWLLRHYVYSYTHVGGVNFEETETFTYKSSPTATPSVTVTVNPTYKTVAHPSIVSTGNSTTTYTNTATTHEEDNVYTKSGWTGTTSLDYQETFEDPLLTADLRTAAIACMENNAWGHASLVVDQDKAYLRMETSATHDSCPSAFEVGAMRFRFIIPHDFDPPPSPFPQKWHGTYHKIEYKLTFVPDSGDPDEVTVGVIEWTGGGTEIDFPLDDDYTGAEQTAIDSWKTAWIEVDPPEEAGETTVSLYRSQCYHGAPWVYH